MVDFICILASLDPNYMKMIRLKLCAFFLSQGQKIILEKYIDYDRAPVTKKKDTTSKKDAKLI